MRNIKKEYKKYVVSYFLIYIIVNMAIIAFNNNLINENTLEILKNSEFMEEFERMVDLHINDKISILTDIDQEKSKIGGLK